MKPLAYVLVLMVAVAGAHLADLNERASAVRHFAWSKTPDLDRIERYGPPGVEACSWRGNGDREALVRALMTVESFATPRFEAWWKTGIVRAGALLGLPIPDLTYGPGRVRLSTADAAIRANGETANDAKLATRLLDSCETKRIVAAVVAQILNAEERGDQAHLDLAAVHTVARIYNGQSEALSPEAAVAHETYDALVYALFQRYRFAALGNSVVGRGRHRLVARA